MNAKDENWVVMLPEYANQYIETCVKSTKEVATGSGKIVNIKERHIPTISYFLNIWLPMLSGVTINRSTYYEWIKSDNSLKSNTIKEIDEKFKALAADIVANEGKGIFYAKNKLGWSDKQITDITLNQINANFGNTLQSPPESENNPRLD